MDEFITRFTSLLRYVPYIREEKAKVQRFVSSLPPYMRERIEFDNPKSMDEVIRKARICYQQSKQKGENASKKWNERKGFKTNGLNKGSRSGKGFGKGQNNINVTRSAAKFKTSNEPKINEQHRKGTEQLSQIHEASTVGEVGRSIPRINAALDDREAEYQPTMVEFEGAKRRVTAKIKDCSLTIAGESVVADLNVLPLGSYDVLIGMDWLERHWSLVDCKTKVIYYKNQNGHKKELQGIQLPVQIRPITATQLAKCIRKGCQMYAIQVGFADSKGKAATLDNIPVVQEFTDVFPEEIPGLPPKINIDFTIELIPGAAPVSRAPYRMSVPELTKLKMQLQELLDKNYIQASVSP
eukprot:PITA_16566